MHRIEEQTAVVKHVLILMDCFSPQMTDDAGSPAATGLVNLIDNTHNNLGPSKYILLPVASRLATFNNQLYPRIVDKIYRELAANLSAYNPSVVSKSLQEVHDLNVFVSQYKDAIRQSVRNSPDQFVAVYQVVPPQMGLEMLIQWINELRFEWLVSHQPSLTVAVLADTKTIFDAIINRLRENNDPNIWDLALQFINQLTGNQKNPEGSIQLQSANLFKPEDDSLNNVREVLLSKLKLEDPTMSQMALNWINNLESLSDSDKAAIAEHLVEWLVAIGRSFRPIIYEAIFKGFSELDAKHRLVYVNHIFDVLILQSSNTEQISYAVKYIGKLPVDVSDFLPKLESILRTSLELRGNNPTLVKSLIEALFTLTENSVNERVRKLHEIARDTLANFKG